MWPTSNFFIIMSLNYYHHHHLECVYKRKFHGNEAGARRERDRERGGGHSGKTIVGQYAREYLSKWSGVRKNWMRENIFLLSCMHSFHRFNIQAKSRRIFSSSIVCALPWTSSFNFSSSSYSFSTCLNMHFMRKLLLKKMFVWCVYGIWGVLVVDEKFTRPIYNFC